MKFLLSNSQIIYVLKRLYKLLEILLKLNLDLIIGRTSKRRLFNATLIFSKFSACFKNRNKSKPAVDDVYLIFDFKPINNGGKTIDI